MFLEKYITNDSVFIIPDHFKDKMISIINDKPLLNVKIVTISQLKNKILFDYDEKTIHFLMKEKNISYKNSIELLNNLYYLDNHKNSKFKDLNLIKQSLDKEQLLIYDNFFLESLNNKSIYVFGFSNISKFNKYLIDKLNNVTFLNEKEVNYNNIVLKFKTINEEIDYIANDILNKYNSGISLNNIFIANYNSDYHLTIKRIFNFYNIPINLENNTSLYDTKYGLKLLNNLSNYKEILLEIEDNNIYNSCIDILNKYYWVDDYLNIKEMLIEEFKNKKISNTKFKNAVNIIELVDNQIDEDEHIYLIGFNDKCIPKIYKDIDYISDIEKNNLLETTEEKNIIEKKIWIKIMKETPNLTISYSELGTKGVLNPSPLIEYLEVKDIIYKASSYSNLSNIYNLGLLSDDFIKYGEIHKEAPKLNNNYPNSGYMTYKNNYQQINSSLIKEYFKNGLYISYTKLNSYYECAFKYYLDYILKLNPYEESFEVYLGNLCHYILSKIYQNDFNFDNEVNYYLKNNHFDLTIENHIFIKMMVSELKEAIEYLKEHYKDTLYQEIMCEKNISIEVDKNKKIYINGIIDKIMSFKNNVAIIDYKTYSSNIDLSLAHYGLKIQLPTYIYLVKKTFPEVNITGIYLQSITRNIINYNPKKTVSEIKNDSLKLVGYTIDNENLIKDFDPSYSNSKYIKSMSLTNNGFNYHTKLLNENYFNKLSELAEKLIINASESILNGSFDINPKILDKTNLSCNYCKYKSICFVNYDNYIYLEADKNLSFLGGDNND